MASITKWSFRDGNRMARTVGRNLKDRVNYTPEEFIEAAEKAAIDHPNEWVIFYTLGDNYMEKGQYARALAACKRCVELKPKDIRSVYALATAYNVLTRASWSDLEVAGVDVLRQALGPLPVLLDRDISRSELDEMGMLAETAAVQAIRWFERARELKPDAESRLQLEEDLGTLYSRFPNLKH